VTFVSLRIIVYPAILGVNLPGRLHFGGEVYLQGVTSPTLHEFWTKFWNVTFLKIILFSPTSSLAPACTRKHELIPIHNALTINLSIKYISLSCLCSITKLLLSITLSMMILAGYINRFLLQHQKHICWDSMMKVLHSTLYMCMRCLEFLFACQSFLLFCVVNCPGISYTGSKGTYIWDQLLPHWGRYDTWHHSSMDVHNGNMFYCSIMIMLQQELLGVLEAIA
jgi:hypothetical protein